MNKLKKIAIIGAGGLGREILGLIRSINKIKQIWEPIGFFDDGTTESAINGIPVLGKVAELNTLQFELAIVVAIGNPTVKKKIITSITSQNVYFPNLMHPSVVLYDSNYITLGQGIVIGANTVLTTNIVINEHVFINIATVICHDCYIDKFSVLMPSVTISTGVRIGEEVYIGNGVKIDQPVTIPNKLRIPIGTLIDNQQKIEKLQNEIIGA